LTPFSPYPFDQDEDNEVTFELPTELTAATTMQLIIDGVSQDVNVASHYTPASGSFQLDAEINTGNLTGDSMSGGLELGLSLGTVAIDGAALFNKWDKHSRKEWKHKKDD